MEVSFPFIINFFTANNFPVLQSNAATTSPKLPLPITYPGFHEIFLPNIFYIKIHVLFQVIMFFLVFFFIIYIKLNFIFLLNLNIYIIFIIFYIIKFIILFIL